MNSQRIVLCFGQKTTNESRKLLNFNNIAGKTCKNAKDFSFKKWRVKKNAEAKTLFEFGANKMELLKTYLYAVST